MSFIQPFRTVLILFLLLFVDVCLYGFFEQQMVYLLLSYSIVCSMVLTTSFFEFGLIFGALAIESVLLYGQWSLILLYTIPLVFIGRRLLVVTNPPSAICALIVAGAICIQLQIANPFILGLAPACMRYTIISIAGTLVGSVFFFLKFQKR